MSEGSHAELKEGSHGCVATRDVNREPVFFGTGSELGRYQSTD